MMVEIASKNWGDQYGQQGEHSKDRLCRLTHITHITIGDQGNDRKSQQTIFQVGLLLEVRGETSSCYNQHDDILNDGHTR